jgi:hypothetical protein
MRRGKVESKPFSLVKPIVTTPFHIDFAWWKEHEGNWRVFLMDYLCEEHQAMFANQEDGALLDHVDPTTGEVHQVDGVQQKLMLHCSKQDGFVEENHSAVDNVFRIFLSNGNSPLTPEQLGHLTGKPADTILRLLSGQRVFMGIRPTQL